MTAFFRIVGARNQPRLPATFRRPHTGHLQPARLQRLQHRLLQGRQAFESVHQHTPRQAGNRPLLPPLPGHARPCIRLQRSVTRQAAHGGAHRPYPAGKGGRILAEAGQLLRPQSVFPHQPIALHGLTRQCTRMRRSGIGGNHPLPQAQLLQPGQRRGRRHPSGHLAQPLAPCAHAGGGRRLPVLRHRASPPVRRQIRRGGQQQRAITQPRHGFLARDGVQQLAFPHHACFNAGCSGRARASRTPKEGA